MGEKETHCSLNLLIAKAQRDRCCMRPFWDTDIKVVARRVKQGSIVRVHRGLYAGKEYWDRTRMSGFGTFSVRYPNGMSDGRSAARARRSCMVWIARTGSCIRFMSRLAETAVRGIRGM